MQWDEIVADHVDGKGDRDVRKQIVLGDREKRKPNVSEAIPTQ